MQFTVVTGLSGAGKTQVVRFLEDMGFFCIDNMPPILIQKCAEMLFSVNGKYNKVAFVIDMRVGDMINELLDNLKTLRESGYECRLLFMDARDDVLVKRYKESRRTHPISSPNGLLGSINEERMLLAKLKNEADAVIDTSSLTLAELQTKLKKLYTRNGSDKDFMTVNVLAFGFKYGVPLDSDLVYDVRCFPNPFYIEGLKTKTGNDPEVRDYVMGFSAPQRFMEKLKDMILFLLPLYVEEGKTSLTISIGCTGGKHRSVTMANVLGEFLLEKGYKINMIYRDIARGR